ncbi:MAG: hypothetical protein ACR2KU_00865 [Gammaproteobacteria bacterium]
MLGIDVCLSKPRPLDQLVETVSKLLETRFNLSPADAGPGVAQA